MTLAGRATSSAATIRRRRRTPPTAPPSWPRWSGSCARGDKALVGNTGFRRFLKTVGDGHFAIDRSKAEEDARFDGVFVLRTNTDLNPLAAMLCYKQLWTVEQTFRTAKHLLSTRPIFHKLDETIRGHVFCSFLALVLKKAELEARIAALGRNGSWPAIIADLDALTETEIEQDGKRFMRPLHAHGPLPASHCVPPASRCRQPCRRSPPTDCRSRTVVPRRRRGANCRALSITCRTALSKMGMTAACAFALKCDKPSAVAPIQTIMCRIQPGTFASRRRIRRRTSLPRQSARVRD